MTVTISRLYDDYDTASQAVSDLEAAGLAEADISIVASNAEKQLEKLKHQSPPKLVIKKPPRAGM